MDEKDRCKKCKGERIVDNEKMIEVPLEKGVPEDKDYCFYGEGDEIVFYQDNIYKSSLGLWLGISISE